MVEKGKEHEYEEDLQKGGKEGMWEGEKAPPKQQLWSLRGGLDKEGGKISL